MISEDQIKVVAGEAMVPRSVVNTVVIRLWRAGQRFTAADVMVGVLEVEHPAIAEWRARRA